MTYFPSRRGMQSIVGGSYGLRVQIGLMGALLVLLLVVHLPFEVPSTPGQWRLGTSADRIALQQVRPDPDEPQSSESADLNAPPPTDLLPPDPAAPASTAPTPDGGAGEKEDESSSQTDDADETVRSLAALSVDDTRPEILGGQQALYLHLRYPKKARDQGIEGRLVLSFTVNEEGKARRIRVQDSLHPVCDSAAVAALESVQFSPARVDDDPVPVRMRLPIQFKLRPDSAASRSYRTASQPQAPGE